MYKIFYMYCEIIFYDIFVKLNDYRSEKIFKIILNFYRVVGLGILKLFTCL